MEYYLLYCIKTFSASIIHKTRNSVEFLDGKKVFFEYREDIAHNLDVKIVVYVRFLSIEVRDKWKS